MEVSLINSNWYAKGYVIVGYKEIGYEIYDEEVYEKNEDPEPIVSYDDFEECLTWIWNS